MSTLITLTGPSCSGKTTLEERLVAAGIPRVISNTSRPPRPGEVDGVHYRFRDRAWFDDKLRQNELIEFVEFNGNLYGNTAGDVLLAMQRCKLDTQPRSWAAVWVIEPHGHKQVRQWCENKAHGLHIHLLSVFVNNPLKVLLERFIAREVELAQLGRKSNIARLDAMLGVEREWVDEAQEDVLHGHQLYDVYLSHLDASNAGEVFNFLLVNAGIDVNLFAKAA